MYFVRRIAVLPLSRSRYPWVGWYQQMTFGELDGRRSVSGASAFAISARRRVQGVLSRDIMVPVWENLLRW